MGKPVAWNEDKPHRCPNCNNVTDVGRKAILKIVTCCRCGCEFTRNPNVYFGRVGVVCKNVEHGHEVRL